MAEENSANDVFNIGICMAGAVSAGAYTAGVMDYLIEALNDYEQRRGKDGAPNHKIRIPVIGGASAGGMTGIITAAALHTNLKPIDKPSGNLMQEHPENKLYHSWVDLTGEDMLKQLLDTSDIEKNGLQSGLNSSFIDAIAKKAIQVGDNPSAIPASFAPNLKIFTTLSSLNGLEYRFTFNKGGLGYGDYYMKIHNDYACFQLSKDSPAQAANNEGKGNFNQGWLPLNFAESIHTETAKNAAMATGAFPVGLKSREVIRKSGYVNALSWLDLATKNTAVRGADYTTLNVDGGMINNEPFEKVAHVLSEETGNQPTADRQDYYLFKSTVLMIDPFPSEQSKVYKPDQNMLKVIGATLSAMISHMRSKPESLYAASKSNCAGQFLIAPSRYIDGGEQDKVEGELAIACGALDGFSGFLSKEFRVHDYFLGRYNCKIFLRDYFTVPKDAIDKNPIFKKGYAGVDLKRFKSRVDNTYQIIPVFADDSYYEFPDIKFKCGKNWPVMDDAVLDSYRSQIKARVQSVVMNVADLSKFQRFLLWGGAKILLNRRLADTVLKTIKISLKKWRLMETDVELEDQGN